MQQSKRQSEFSAIEIRQVFVIQSTKTWQFLAADLSFVGNLSWVGRFYNWDEAFETGSAHLGQDFVVHTFYKVVALDNVVEFGEEET